LILGLIKFFYANNIMNLNLVSKSISFKEIMYLLIYYFLENFCIYNLFSWTLLETIVNKYRNI